MSSMLVALVLVAPVALQCTPVGSVALSWRRRLACSCYSTLSGFVLVGLEGTADQANHSFLLLFLLF